jgi:acetate kinase
MEYILAINAGSSSLKVGIYEHKSLKLVQKFHFKEVKNHSKNLQKVAEEYTDKKIVAVCHRVVHGGETYTEATLITKSVENEIKRLAPLAPIHNPVNLECIKLAKKYFKTPHFAIFDTAYFSELPAKAYLYGIPNKYYFDDKIRKYGFHGTNHKYIYTEVNKALAKRKSSGIICHLGNGCSISAIKKGKPIDISMGYSPTDGVIMGTRSGTLDPEIIFYLQRRYPRLNVQKMLQTKSGLLGLSQLSSNMREVYLAAKKGHKQSQITIDTYCYKIASYVGFYANLLPELDFIVFTGGTGENAPYVRKKVMLNLPGLVIDQEQVFILKANEELQMAIETKNELAKLGKI